MAASAGPLLCFRCGIVEHLLRSSPRPESLRRQGLPRSTKHGGGPSAPRGGLFQPPGLPTSDWGVGDGNGGEIQLGCSLLGIITFSGGGGTGEQPVSLHLNA